MDTDATVRKELRKFINELQESLFGGLESSLEELNKFFNMHVNSGQIDSGYESQYNSLYDEFKKQLDEFCQIIENVKKITG